MIKMNDERLGLLLSVLASLGFAGKTVLAKLAYQHGVAPVTLLAVRMAFAGAVFGGVLGYNLARKRWTLGLTGRQWPAVAALGVFGYYLSALLDFSGLQYVDATLGRMILFLYPTLVVLLNAGLRRQAVRSGVWAALALSYSGLALMMAPRLGGPQADFRLGSALIFSGALTFAVYLVGLERLLQTAGSIARLTTLILCVSCLAVVGHFLLTHPVTDLLVPAPVLIHGALMGLLSTVMPIYAMTAGIALIGANRAVLIGLLGPVLTFALGYFLLDERLTPLQFSGMALIIAGVWRARG